MALIDCKECGAQVSTHASACPSCGAKVPKTMWWLWIPLSLVVAFFGFGAIVGSSPEAKQRAKERAIIDQCWDDFEDRRNVLSFAQRDFLSEACKHLETEYRRKWGRAP